MHNTKKSQLQGILSDMDSTCDGVDDLTDYNDAVDELQKVETFCDALEDGRLTNTDDALDDINEKLGENCVDYLEFLDDNALSKSEDVSFNACCYFKQYTTINYSMTMFIDREAFKYKHGLYFLQIIVKNRPSSH